MIDFNNKEKYIFRRQFIITSKEKDLNKYWISERLNDNLHLYIHEDLGLTTSTLDKRKLYLLGYIIDPNNYNYDNEQILNRLLEKSNDFKTLVDQSLSLSGRWILIYKEDDNLYLFNDPSSLRQVYYSKGEDILIGSNPNILNKFIKHDLRDDKEFKDYVSSNFFKVNEMEWYSDKSYYKNMRKLLPNHFLDIRKRKTKRFWISLDESSYDENIKRVGDILVDEFKAISLRDIGKIQSLTAGYDSRTIFAASIKASSNFSFFLSTMNILNKDSADIKFARSILKNYGKSLKIIDKLKELDDDFLKLYKNNIDHASILPKTLTIQHIFYLNKDLIHITGNNSAVFKDYYDKSTASSGKEISKLIGIPSNLVIFDKYFDEWINSVKEIVENDGIDMMKLFYWENRLSNWGVQYQQESDIANEEFAPFNNREIFIRLIYASKEKGKSEEDIFKDIIKYLEPNLLNYPFNPESGSQKLKSFIKSKVSKRTWQKLKSLLKANN